MIRRQARQRREYIYRKALEAKELQIYERKQAIREALASGKSIPTELRKDAKELAGSLSLDAAQNEPSTHVDDEYSRAGIYDPKILITTSRDPSSRLQQFAKASVDLNLPTYANQATILERSEDATRLFRDDADILVDPIRLAFFQEMRLVFPNSHRINRGNYVVKDLAAFCRSNDISDLIVLHEHRGVPDALIVSHFPHGPTTLFTLHNVVLRHEVSAQGQSTVSEQFPHLIFDGFGSRLGERVKSVLKYLFPVPKEDSKRIMTFANERDYISFRHHVYVKTSHKEVQLAEVGPRFEMRPYEIRQGTIEQTEADVEWVLRPYQRTARKRNQL